MNLNLIAGVIAILAGWAVFVGGIYIVEREVRENELVEVPQAEVKPGKTYIIKNGIYDETHPVKLYIKRKDL